MKRSPKSALQANTGRTKLMHSRYPFLRTTSSAKLAKLKAGR